MSANIEIIFATARELQAVDRSGYLDEACAGDEELRAKVEALLAADADAGSFLKTAHNPDRDPDATHSMSRAYQDSKIPAEQAGEIIGRYKLLQQIGEGGFGTVWMAEQKVPVRRRIALKIIKLGMDTKQIIARFEAERQALAMMDHPNIAKVFDAGSTDAGRPYFVMELVRGIPILEYCDTEKLDTKSRLKLFILVCNAIQHAHQKGIIHRDIKPSNVLVTLHDGEPVPKVIDFGIAKATNQELTQKTLYTEFNQMVGTPAYMSPEQAEMSGLDIDTRSDIYSLGVLLYELLTGTTPFNHKELMDRGFAEMMRVIREETPHKPSTRLSSLGQTGTRTAEQRQIDLKKLGTVLRGDLDWIVMRCLEKNRTRRYDTATGLAADINRHLNDQPVEAGPPSVGYKMRKFVRRNKGMVIAGSAIAATLFLGVIGTTIGLRIAQHNAKAALNNAQIAQSARDELSEVNTTLVEQTDEAEWSSYTANLALAQAAMDAGNWPEARERVAQCPESKRGWEWQFLSNKAASVIAEFPEDSKLSPDGKMILAILNGPNVILMDLEGKQIGDPIYNGDDLDYGSPVFTADGKHIVVGTKNPDTIKIYDFSGTMTAHLAEMPELDHEPLVLTSADGKWIIAEGKDNTLRLWDSRGRATGVEFHSDAQIQTALFTPDSKTFITSSDDGIVRIWNLEGIQISEIHSSDTHYEVSLDVSPDSELLVTGADGVAQIWDMQGNAVGTEMKNPLSGNYYIHTEFSQDGQTILIYGTDRYRLWNRDGSPKGEVIRAQNSRYPQASGDAQYMVTLSSYSLQLRETDGRPLGAPYITSNFTRGYLYVPGEQYIILQYIDARTYRENNYLLPFPLRTTDHIIPSLRDSRAIFRTSDYPLLNITADMNMDLADLNRIDSSASQAALDLDPDAMYSAALPDGSRIVTADDKTIRFWDPKTRRELAAIRTFGGITNLAFTPDGTRLEIQFNTGSVRILDIRTVDEQAAEVQRRWAERVPAGQYLDTLMGGPTPSDDLLPAIKADPSLSPVRRLVAAQVLDERLADINAQADRAFEAITKDQTDKAIVLAAATDADLPVRVKERLLATAEKWEYEPRRFQTRSSWPRPKRRSS